ncbi:hypothetical protein ACYSNV_03805 [Myroides sp. LJL119]
MLQQITQLIQKVALKDLQASQIASDLQPKAVELTAKSVLQGLTENATSASKLGDLTSLLQGSGQNINNNPIVGSIIKELVGSLSGKLGIPDSMANGFASLVVPNIIGAISQNMNASDKSFSLSDLLTGLALDGDSKTGISDFLKADNSKATSLVTGALKGFFK